MPSMFGPYRPLGSIPVFGASVELPEHQRHAADPEVRKAYAAKWRVVMREHAQSSWDFLAGMLEREFPHGTFHPPMITVFNLKASNRPPPSTSPP